MSIRRVHSLAVIAAFTAVFAIFAVAATSAQAAISTSVKTEYFKNACDGTLVPATQTIDRTVSNTASFEVTLLKNTTGASTAAAAYRDCDTGVGKTAPAAGVELEWEVTSGPCAGKKGTGVTGANGKFTFSLEGCGCGPDKIKLRVKKVVFRVTTTTKTETTRNCTSWLVLICLNWKEETKVISSTSTSVITDTYWFDVGDAFTVIWIGCDTTPPGKPTIVCSGTPANDNIPTLSGTAEPGSTVTVFADGNAIGTTTADGSGAWTFTPSTPLGDGVHLFTVTATDAAGNESASSESCTKTIDTEPPAVTVTCSEPSTEAKPTIAGTASPGATVTIYIDGTEAGTAVAGVDGAWTFVPTTPLTPGSHQITVKATDGAGNSSPLSEACTLTITTPPTPPPPEPPTPPNPPVVGQGVPTATLTIAKTCTKPYILIKPSTIGGTPRSMVVYVDNKRVGSDAKAPLQFRLYTKRFTAKNHRVKVVVRFTNGGTATVTKRFKPCVRFSASARIAPRFTG